MSIDRFLEPKLTGARFKDHAVPLEFLKDLAVLEEVITEVAKAEFLKEHQDRKRSPRRFTEGVEFKLTAIEDGSARPVISLVLAATTLFPPESQTYFELARDAVVNAIAAAEQDRSVTAYLPEKTLGYFDRLGRSLRDGEAIEFTRGQQPPARLTKETRRKILLASPTVTELTEETSVRGTVPEVDQADMTFEIQLVDGRKIKSPVSAQHLDTILEAFNGYKRNTRILLQGIGRFDRKERLLRFDSIEHANVLDPLDIPARVEELRLLKDGWLEGGGAAPEHGALNWLIEAFSNNYPDDLIPPYLYPTEGGAIRAEWSVSGNEISLDIDLAKHRGGWHALNMETDVDEVRDLNLDDAAGWTWLVEQLRQRSGGAA